MSCEIVPKYILQEKGQPKYILNSTQPKKTWYEIVPGKVTYNTTHDVLRDPFETKILPHALQGR
jgi:hypothetical protein